MKLCENAEGYGRRRPSRKPHRARIVNNLVRDFLDRGFCKGFVGSKSGNHPGRSGKLPLRTSYRGDDCDVLPCDKPFTKSTDPENLEPNYYDPGSYVVFAMAYAIP